MISSNTSEGKHASQGLKQSEKKVMNNIVKDYNFFVCPHHWDDEGKYAIDFVTFQFITLSSGSAFQITAFLVPLFLVQLVLVLLFLVGSALQYQRTGWYMFDLKFKLHKYRKRERETTKQIVFVIIKMYCYCMNVHWNYMFFSRNSKVAYVCSSSNDIG